MTEQDPGTPTRRTVVTGVGLAALAVAVPGCTTYGAASSPSTAAAPAGTALAKTSDIPVGGGKVFGDAQVVVTQPTQGTFKCFTAICTHQGCTVADVANGTINCGCHGSKFNASDGAVVNGPASTPLAAQQITVTGDSIQLGGQAKPDKPTETPTTEEQTPEEQTPEEQTPEEQTPEEQTPEPAKSKATAEAGPVLAATAEIPVGGGKVFGDQQVVVTQPSKGSFKCFTAVCTHQGCTVADVGGGTINCGCHGSKFNIADGSVARSPAQRPLKSKRISVQDGAIRLA
jgi:Rieske Fe-S protein